jgi:hypothetical protein
VGSESINNVNFALIEHWDGSNWSVFSSPTVQGGLSDVTAISTSDIWAVGGPLAEHWDGTRWTVDSTFPGSDAIAISADASNDVWAVGSSTALHFNGTNWSAAALPTGPIIVAVTALSPTNVWAVGAIPGTVKHPGRPAVEHWDGTSWSIVASPIVSGGGLHGVAAISANDIWAVGNASVQETLTEHWDGKSWSIVHSPNPAVNQNLLNGVTALSDGTVAAVGHQEDINTDQPMILMNAGSTPKSLTTAGAPTTATLAPLDAAAVDQLFAAAVAAGQPLWLTGHSARAHKVAAKGARDDLPRDIGSWDRA